MTDGSTTVRSSRVELIALRHIGLVEEGDDLPTLILDAFVKDRITLRDGDVVAIAQKIVSKSEGRYAYLADITPTGRAHELAAQCQKDPRLIELILQESREVLRCAPGVIVVENHQGVILANAGIDRSNVDQTSKGERVLLLPKDPDASCANIRTKLSKLANVQIGVVINDSIGRAWRKGTIGTAIGAAGLPALQDMRGQADMFGFKLRTTEVGTADEIAAAASLLMGQSAEATPVVLLRGLPQWRHSGSAADIIRPRSEDMFR